LYQSLGDEALLRQALAGEEFTISPVIYPLPRTAVEGTYGAAEDSFIAWFLVVLSFPFISGSFATFIVSEAQSKAKHLQTVAGVKPSAYWLSTYLWDIANYQISCWITIILMLAFGIETFTTTEREVVGGVIVLLLLFGPATAGFTYCVSFLFKSPSMCNLFVIVFNFLIGMAGPLVTFILRLIGEDPGNRNETLITVSIVLEWVLRVLPSFCLGRGLFAAINIESLEYLAGKPLNFWSPQVSLYEVIFLGVESFVYIILTIQIDKWHSNPRAVLIWRSFVRFITCRCCCGGGASPGGPVPAPFFDDEDVIAEQDRVLSGQANDDIIVLDQLTKVFPPHKVAVNHLSLAIPPGQCFGLLGINGAGKTTTMGLLTAEFPPTSGDATLAGYSVTNEPEQTRRRIGYCPQFDALFQNMTGIEHVELYAAIKGVPRKYIKEAANSKLDEMGLSEKDRLRLAANYSGGMKRKLSVACATIGQPQIVFLDEPSTGMDPVARRDMWQVISNMVSAANVPDEERTSVILTTHSMEECEALCPRIGIMAGGILRCLGSAQHLKTRFGQGYQVEMRLLLVANTDHDYVATLAKLQEGTAAAGGEEGGVSPEEVFLNLDEATAALRSLTDDDYSLADMVEPTNQIGYPVYKSATSPVGVPLDELASFATEELRMRKLTQFFESSYESAELRERQETKVRYEIGSSDGLRISQIFANIESHKEDLMLADYGVSQTSLEQVFNFFAAEAERRKQGTVDN
jgi:ABC-type multidrug transport system ATPase subunit